MIGGRGMKDKLEDWIIRLSRIPRIKRSKGASYEAEAFIPGAVAVEQFGFGARHYARGCKSDYTGGGGQSHWGNHLFQC